MISPSKFEAGKPYIEEGALSVGTARFFLVVPIKIKKPEGTVFIAQVDPGKVFLYRIRKDWDYYVTSKTFIKPKAEHYYGIFDAMFSPKGDLGYVS